MRGVWVENNLMNTQITPKKFNLFLSTVYIPRCPHLPLNHTVVAQKKLFAIFSVVKG